jgi:tetratricopeptide (TPR) repeat protein
MTIEQDFALGFQHHKAGRLEEAQRQYQQVLRDDPDHCNALHLLGVIAHQLGNSGAAVDLITKALVINAEFSEAYFNLGVAQQELARYDEAAASYIKTISLNPENARAHGSLGLMLQKMGRLEEACTSYQKSLTIMPDNAEVLFNFGTALHGVSRLADAAARYRKVIDLKRDAHDAYNNLGNTLMAMGQMQEAVEILKQAVALVPENAIAHSNLGNAQRLLGQKKEAVSSYRKAIELAPELVESHSNLGLALQGLGRLDEAVIHFQEAISINPDFTEAHFNLGIAFMNMGRLEDAQNQYRSALSLKPDFADASRLMAYIKKHSEYDEDIQAMERAYGDPAIRDEQKMHLAFGLGKAFEDLRRYDEAFDYYFEGNALNRKTITFSIDQREHFFSRIKDVFDESLFSKLDDAGDEDETPVFILGMPRSGTTLVEQVLASHPQVYGAGELGVLSRLAPSYFESPNGIEFPENMGQLGSADYESMGAEYIKFIRELSHDSRFISNKTPDNYIYLGAIKLALPKARIIHCKRNPADNGLSLFKSFFPNKGHAYAYNLKEIGQQYRLYADLMEHWQRVVPGFIHEIQYEDMVGDLSGQTRSLLEFCGLDWDDACLDFHKSDRPVMTASAEQVRRPIYKTSVQAFKRYEKQLAPMLEVLPKV